MLHRLYFLTGIAVACLPISAWTAGLALDEDLGHWTVPNFGAEANIQAAGVSGQNGPVLWTQVKAPDWNRELKADLLVPDACAQVIFQGRIRAQGVKRGPEDFTMARAMLYFFDEHGNHIGGYPHETNLEGTTGWKAFRQVYVPPKGAYSMQVMVGLTNAAGEVYYDDLLVEARSSVGKVLKVEKPADYFLTNTAGWWVFDPGAEDTARELIADFSTLLHRPAGSQGQIVIKDGVFASSESGKEVRFWGTNIGPPTTWPSKREADQLADRLARSGINLVRFHHMDRGWNPDNLFEAGVDHTQSFDAQKRDRMDYLFAAFKKRGIYTWFDLLVTRKFRAGDGVVDYQDLEYGAKIAGYFDERIIELQEEYAKDLLSHTNPYTGLTYLEDPALALIGIFNESNLFLKGGVGSWDRVPDYYHKMIDRRFRAWARNQIPSKAEKSVAELVKAEDEDVYRFLMELQVAYFERMRDYLKALGSRALLSGSNFQECVADMRSNLCLDFMDMHMYWDHPQGGWGPTNRVDNHAITKHLPGDNIITRPARMKSSGMPLSISEWQTCWPNEWITEGPLIMSAYASFQQWSAPMQFVFEKSRWSSRMDGSFGAGDKPHSAIPLAAASLIYLRGDVRPGPLLPIASSAQPLVAPPGSQIASHDILRYRVEQRFDVEKLPAIDRAAMGRGQWSSADGQLRGTDSVFYVDTERSQAFVGFPKGEILKTTDFAARTDAEFAQFMLSSLDDKPISESSSMLVTVTARAENTDQRYRPFKKGLLTLGKGPILLEPVKAKVFVKRSEVNKGRPKLVALDWYGRETSVEIPVQYEADKNLLIFEIGHTPAYWFHLTFEG